jgi:hypothetical protein
VPARTPFEVLAPELPHPLQVRQHARDSHQAGRLADGPETDPDYSFNPIGDLQANGVERHLVRQAGQSRELLKLFRQAQERTAHRGPRVTATGGRARAPHGRLPRCTGGR